NHDADSGSRRDVRSFRNVSRVRKTMTLFGPSISRHGPLVLAGHRHESDALVRTFDSVDPVPTALSADGGNRASRTPLGAAVVRPRRALPLAAVPDARRRCGVRGTDPARL